MKVFSILPKPAEALNVSNANVSDVIALTKLPDVVLDAFSSRLDLQVRWVSLLNGNRKNVRIRYFQVHRT